MKKIQAVLFDLGNTLSRSASLSRSLTVLVNSPIAQKLNLSKQQLQDIGIEIEQQISDLYREERLDQPDWQQVWERGTRNCGFDLSFDEVERLCRATFHNL